MTGAMTRARALPIDNARRSWAGEEVRAVVGACAGC
jgi:hypothetical protein